MMLFYSPIHGFIHKVLVVAHEAGLWDELDFVPVYPVKDGYSISAINPLHKVPTLVLDDYTVLYGSQTIVEYLDDNSISGKKLYPVDKKSRWDALRRLALADTVFEVTVVMALERLQSPPRDTVFSWNWPKVVRSVDQMNEDSNGDSKDFDIGHASTLHALSYLDRQTKRGLHKSIPEDWDWRDGRLNLHKWFDEAIQRPSVTSHFNKEYDGDDSPEFCQRKIAEVLKSQGKTLPKKFTSHSVDFVPPGD